VFVVLVGPGLLLLLLLLPWASRVVATMISTEVLGAGLGMGVGMASSNFFSQGNGTKFSRP
jgi:hypothetical protein